MGTFLVALASQQEFERSRQIFDSSLALAKQLTPSKTAVTHHSGVGHCACFPRENGTRSAPTVDAQTGSWLVTAGTWFHRDGFASSGEARLLSSFLEVGVQETVQQLEGFFTIVFFDAQTSYTFVITDIAGSCHTFIREMNGIVLLASSSLLLGGVQHAAPDPLACQEFVNLGIVYEDRTIFKEVRKLPPGSILRFRQASLQQTTRYWKPADLEPESLRGEMAVAAVWDGLTSAAKRIIQAFPRAICDLTGGYDSRSVLAGFLGVGSKVATAVTGNDNDPDVRVSRALAATFSLPHVQTRPPSEISFEEFAGALSFTDGECNLFDYCQTLRVHRGLCSQFTLSVNGSLGETARGYWWELLVPHTGRRQKLDTRMLAQARFVPRSADLSIFAPNARADFADHLAGVIDRANVGLEDSPNTFQMDNAYLMLRMQRWQGRIASSTNRVWPCLSPFLFRSILEPILQTPSSLRKRSLLIRRMLDRFIPKLANAPLEHGYPAVPAKLTNLHRFLPLLDYYRDRAATKLGKRLGVRQQNSSQSLIAATRLSFWREERARELLRMGEMHSGELFDSSLLASYLDHSQHAEFAFDAQWMRLLSLEYALQTLQAAKGTAATAT